MDAIKDLITTIARAIVDKPEHVSISKIEGDQSLVFELSVAKRDLGNIIGKHGKIVRAIRTILTSISGRAKKRVVLVILE